MREAARGAEGGGRPFSGGCGHGRGARVDRAPRGRSLPSLRPAVWSSAACSPRPGAGGHRQAAGWIPTAAAQLVRGSSGRWRLAVPGPGAAVRVPGDTVRSRSICRCLPYGTGKGRLSCS